MASTGLHEDPGQLGKDVVDTHRAIVSLMEELEAMDWYNQRVAATTDPELRQILIHNRDEEKEHAAMVLEWLRRKDPIFEAHLKTYLFKEGPIKEESKGEASGEVGSDESSISTGLGLGSLKRGR